MNVATPVKRHCLFIKKSIHCIVVVASVLSYKSGKDLENSSDKMLLNSCIKNEQESLIFFMIV